MGIETNKQQFKGFKPGGTPTRSMGIETSETFMIEYVSEELPRAVWELKQNKIIILNRLKCVELPRAVWELKLDTVGCEKHLQ